MKETKGVILTEGIETDTIIFPGEIEIDTGTKLFPEEIDTGIIIFPEEIKFSNTKTRTEAIVGKDIINNDQNMEIIKNMQLDAMVELAEIANRINKRNAELKITKDWNLDSVSININPGKSNYTLQEKERNIMEEIEYLKDYMERLPRLMKIIKCEEKIEKLKKQLKEIREEGNTLNIEGIEENSGCFKWILEMIWWIFGI